jgi:hypothetical protein
MSAQYKNPGRIEFDGKLGRGEGGGTFVIFPHDVEKLYAVKGRVPVKILDRYRSLSFTRQREYNLWIENAKQPETRLRRINKAVAELQAGLGAK